MGCGNRKTVPKVQKRNETQELGGWEGGAAAQPIDLSHVRGDVRRAQVAGRDLSGFGAIQIVVKLRPSGPAEPSEEHRLAWAAHRWVSEG